jgi:predicted transcriptional regulator
MDGRRWYTAKDLAFRVRVSHTTMCNRLNRLLEIGYVENRKKPAIGGGHFFEWHRVISF